MLSLIPVVNLQFYHVTQSLTYRIAQTLLDYYYFLDQTLLDYYKALLRDL